MACVWWGSMMVAMICVRILVLLVASLWMRRDASMMLRPRPAFSIFVGMRLVPLLAVFFVLARVARLMSHTWTALSLVVGQSMGQRMAGFLAGRFTGGGRHQEAAPTYYALLHVWTAVFGTSAVAVRPLSAVCMVGA